MKLFLIILPLLIYSELTYTQTREMHIRAEILRPDCTFDTLLIFDTTTYGNDIFGVGKDTAKVFFQPKSTSTSYKAVTIEVTTDIGNDNYLVCGHNNGSLTRSPIGDEANAIQRIWKADMSGAIGTVNLELDLALITALTGSPPNNIKILVANNPSLNNYIAIEASAVVAGIAYFNGIPLYNKYFTFSAP